MATAGRRHRTFQSGEQICQIFVCARLRTCTGRRHSRKWRRPRVRDPPRRPPFQPVIIRAQGALYPCAPPSRVPHSAGPVAEAKSHHAEVADTFDAKFRGVTSAYVSLNFSPPRLFFCRCDIDGSTDSISDGYIKGPAEAKFPKQSHRAQYPQLKSPRLYLPPVLAQSNAPLR
jgi:hypothetical protein